MMKQEPQLEVWLKQHGASASFASLAELVPGGATIVTDRDGRVVYWSREAERLFGYVGDFVIGKPCPEGVVCKGRQFHGFGAIVQVRRGDGSPVQVQHWSQVTGDGQAAVHLLMLSPGAAAGAPSTASAPPPPADTVDFHGLLTRDPAMLRAIELIRNVAETEATVLVRGESGTGKELVARAIHEEGPRRGKPWVAVNCAAFTPTLLESELFGHVRGAFTGAVSAREGIFAQADGGTLFLDEVAELPLELQAKLLRVLQERVVVPVGGAQPRAVDVRVVAATHRSLREEVRAGRFREDLMYRLRVVPVFLPPLRERRADVEMLARHFAGQFAARPPHRALSFSGEVMQRLLDYAWPGNVRELRNVVEYAYAVGAGRELSVADLPPEFRERRPVPPVPAAAEPLSLPSVPPRVAVSEAERVRAALEAAGGDLEQAAQILGVSRVTLWRMRKRLGIVKAPA